MTTVFLKYTWLKSRALWSLYCLQVIREALRQCIMSQSHELNNILNSSYKLFDYLPYRSLTNKIIANFKFVFSRF